MPVKAAILKVALPGLLDVPEIQNRLIRDFPDYFPHGVAVAMPPEKEVEVLESAVSTAIELARDSRSFQKLADEGDKGRMFCAIFALAYTTAIRNDAAEPVQEYMLALRDTLTPLNNIAPVMGPLTPVCRQMIMMAMQNRYVDLGSAQTAAARGGFRIV